MTIRRWLKKRDQELLPTKYFALLGPRFGKIQMPELPKFSLARALKDLSMSELMNQIEERGSRFISQRRKRSSDQRSLESRIKSKLALLENDESFVDCCKKLLQITKSADADARAKAIAVGALLYFSEPIELADAAPFIDYLGELAVLSVALNTAYALNVFNDESDVAPNQTT